MRIRSHERLIALELMSYQKPVMSRKDNAVRNFGTWGNRTRCEVPHLVVLHGSGAPM
jgi:hypothetical protein